MCSFLGQHKNGKANSLLAPRRDPTTETEAPHTGHTEEYPARVKGVESKMGQGGRCGPGGRCSVWAAAAVAMVGGAGSDRFGGVGIGSGGGGGKMIVSVPLFAVVGPP